MAVTGPSTLVSTIDSFLQHWTLANQRSAPDRPLEVLQNLLRNDLLALRERLQRGPAAVTTAVEEELWASEATVALLQRLLVAMKKYHGLIRGHFPESRWQRLLAPVPGAKARPAVWRPAFGHTLFCWRKVAPLLPNSSVVIDASSLPYGAETFADDLQKLEAAYLTVLDCEAETALAEAEWEIWHEQAMAVMKAYGHAVKARFGNASSLAATLPQLWPGPKRGERRKKRRTA